MKQEGRIIAVLLIAAAVLLSACRQKSKRVVGLVPKGATQVFWQAVHAGGIKAGREFDLEVLWNAPPLESDSSRQIAIVDALINRRVDGIALAPVDRTALVGVMHRAIDAGIAAVVFDSGLDSSRPASYIATDNREAGRMAARRLGEVLRGTGKVLIISDGPASASTMQRVAGFKEQATAFAELDLLTVQYVMADRAKARAVAENILTAHTDLAGIFADHENAAGGAVLALKSRQNHTVKLVGFDASEQLIADLKEGWVDSLVVQNPFRMGYESVRALGLVLAGRKPNRQIDTGSTVVLREDLNRPDVRGLLFPDLRSYLGAGTSGR
jgi:ribose transport system substrate-binding protein